MIQDRTLVKIADNSGGTIGRVFKVLGSSKKRYAELGEEVKNTISHRARALGCSCGRGIERHVGT